MSGDNVLVMIARDRKDTVFLPRGNCAATKSLLWYVHFSARWKTRLGGEASSV